MVNKKNWLRMMVMLLVSAMIVTGCNDGSSNGGGGGNTGKLIITSIPSEGRGQKADIGIFTAGSEPSGPEDTTGLVAGAENVTASASTLTVTLLDFSTGKPWKGTGTFDVYFIMGPQINMALGISFRNGCAKIDVTEFAGIENPTGSITGTFTLSNIPAGATLRIIAYQRDDGVEWQPHGRDYKLSTTLPAGHTLTDFPFEINLYDNEQGDFVPGAKTRFVVEVAWPDTSRIAIHFTDYFSTAVTNHNGTNNVGYIGSAAVPANTKLVSGSVSTITIPADKTFRALYIHLGDGVSSEIRSVNGGTWAVRVGNSSPSYFSAYADATDLTGYWKENITSWNGSTTSGINLGAITFTEADSY